MSSSPIDPAQDERRAAYRCAVAGDRAAAVLRLGTRQVAAEIVDESAKGFAIVVEEGIRAEQGEKLSLCTADGWVEVEVKNVQFQQWSSMDDGTTATVKTRTRLGLMRLRDLEVFQPTESFLRSLSLAGMRKLLGMMRPFTGSLVRVAGLIVGMLVVVGALIWGLEHTLVTERKIVKELPQPAAVEQRPSKPARIVERTLPDILRPEKVPLPSLPVEPVTDDVLRMLSRPEVLFEPDIVSRLVLSPQQLRELEQIYASATRTDLAGKLPGSSADGLTSAERELEIARKGLSVLTESQRRSILRILAEAHAKQSKTNPTVNTGSAPTDGAKVEGL